MVARARAAVAQVAPFMGGANEEAAKAPAADPAPTVAPPVEDKLPFSEVPLTPVEPASSPAADLASLLADEAPEPVVEEKKIVEKKVVEKAVRKPRRRRAVKPTPVAAAKRPAAKKAATKKAPAKGIDALMGTYVAVTLKTGNVVKGILLEKTATNYKIELPGMGGFDYPVDSVKGIAAAE